MRLTAIRLAGFKSFVDPTTFTAPNNLTGIVGPNGCGKSNIIDAIRWVMGEGSAKVLRGESMSDVIFSGSSGRKPVGTATVELLFDNSDGRVGGQLASYSEISVKRQVSRDGVSMYLLNGTRCRRKDIRDLFLGTGLGSRSYSIIEQGMISEIVDARPEDIRAHLEEAAGISRYKERRRETERRISHTRDNLARLADLREEVGKHLGRLKRQAQAANRYSRLQQEKRDLESRLLALRWREMRARSTSGSEGLAKQETAVQESIASQRSIETALEKLHDQQGHASEEFNEIQGRLYEVGSEIARLEQSIAHARELQQRQQQEFDETRSALADLEKHMGLDKAQVEELTRSLAEVEPELKLAEKRETAAIAVVTQAEAEVSSWQQAFETHHASSAKQNSEADQLRSEVEMLDQRLLDAVSRQEILLAESKHTDTSQLSERVNSLSKEVASLTKQEEKDTKALQVSRQSAARLKDALLEIVEETGQMNKALHTAQGKLESLKLIQAEALQEGNGENWLQSNGLESAKVLAKVIDVDSGWEDSVETVLGNWLESLIVDKGQLDKLALGKSLDGVNDISMSLLENHKGTTKPVTGTLGEKVRGPDTVISWLNEVLVAQSLEEALKIQKSLSNGQSVITAGGEWLGAGWIRVTKGSSGGTGMLEREKAIEDLEQANGDMVARLAKLRAKAGELESEAADLRLGGIELQEKVNLLHRQRSELDGQLNSGRAKMNMLDGRQKTINDETQGLEQQIKEDKKRLRKARGKLESMVEQMASLHEERESLVGRRSGLMKFRDDARSEARESQNQRHELAMKTGARSASLDSLRQSLVRMDTQLSQVQQRYLSLSEQIAKQESPEKTHAQEMEKLLQRRVETDGQLAAAREKLQQLEEDYRQQDGARQAAVQLADERRSVLESTRLKQQEIELNTRAIRQQVEELGGDAEQLAKEIPEDADSDVWLQEIERLQINITRLEPVNLAAIQEFEEEKKRKDYLDSQDADLCEALTTLENAIAKIDRKTRTRFKDTFERVNKGVQELFPRLFGGGHGYLELTGEDLLTTGVSIMARPPGKRVSSIHLLSGGEKALTAVAFVFAIFRLNPAPFCLLDEVDAPLDDANVARFCSMVTEMAETVQFIFVTHNKITMEMAEQMSGVTMREPGVSRLVQVDIAEAARMAST